MVELSVVVKKIQQSQVGCSHFLVYRNKELKKFLFVPYLQVTNQFDYTFSILGAQQFLG